MIIACRFVPYDQWLVTHVDPSKSIRQIKHALLARCIGSFQQTSSAQYRPSSPLTFAPYPPQRPISPITFAKPPVLRRTRRRLRSPSFSDSDTDHPFRSRDDQLDVVEEQDSPYSSDAQDSVTSSTPPQHHIPNRSSFSSLPHVSVPDPPDSPPPITPYISPEDAKIISQFSIIRFSTGQVLEDDFQATWYSIRSHELLEIHHSGVVLHLPRTFAQEYAQPYFETQARVLTLSSGPGNSHVDDEKLRTRHPPEDEKRNKIKDKDKTNDRDRPKKTKHRDPDPPAKLERARTKKHKLEWKDKWLVVHTGVVSICQDSNDTTPHRYPLSSLIALRGVEHLADANLIRPFPQRIICAEFRTRQDTSIYTTQHGKENSKGKDPERKRPSTPPMPSANVGSSYLTSPGMVGTSADNVALKKSALRPTRSRDTDLSVTRSPGRLTRGDPKGKSRNPQQPPTSLSHKTGMSAASSPTESSFALPTDTINSTGGSFEDVIVYTNEDGENPGLDSLGFGEGEDEDGEWVILDMPDDDAYNSILRIFHRHFTPPMSSSFLPALLHIPSRTSTPYYTPLPSPTIPTFATSDHSFTDPSRSNARAWGTMPSRPPEKIGDLTAGPIHNPLHAIGALPYPEWRIAVIERAQRAGVGDISPALGLFLWGGSLLPLGEELSVEPDQQSEDGERMTSRSVPTTVSNDDDGGSRISLPGVDESGPRGDKGQGDTRSVLSNESNEERSEAEWEGWMGDLGRQQERYITGRFGEGNSGSLPEIPWTLRDPGSSGTYEESHGSSVTKQRRTQQARRALEPSAVVSRTSKAYRRPRTVMVTASTMSSSPSTVSVSTDVSAEMPTFSGYTVVHGMDIYRAPLRTKMSIEEVLESGAPGPAEVLGGTISGSQQVGFDPIVDERRIAAPEAGCSPLARTPSTRKRAATSAEAVSSPSFASIDDPSSSNPALSAKKSTSSSRKGKEVEKISTKDAVHDKHTLPNSKSVSSYTTTTEGMISTTSLSSLAPTRGRISTSDSGSIRSRSRMSILRHARSGSSLYDVAGSEQVSIGSGSGRKGGGFSLIRGVSVRAGRFVKGLDAALDFVDGL